MKKEINNNNNKNDYDASQNTSTIYEQLRCCPFRYKKRSMPLASSDDNWVSQLIPETKFEEPIPLSIRKQLKTFAQKIYKDNVEAFKSVKSKRQSFGNKDFHGALLSHGTARDKIAAYMFKCMESPLYTLEELFSLVDFINPNLKSSSKAIADIASVFQTSLLPDGHVAKEFECHNFMNLTQYLRTNFEQVERQLMLWYFENEVRSAYLKFVENIDKLCYDTRSKVKASGVKGLHIIFKNHPLQDSELVLQKFVNKLGDTNKNVKGLVLHAVTNLQKDHPAIKTMLISLVEELLCRPNVHSGAQYSGLCFLRDIILSKAEVSVALKLVKIYFQFFELCSKKGEVDSRFMATILRGLNRAYPYLKDSNPEILNKQIETLYKLCHLVNFSVGIQALQLIYQVQSTSEDVPSDRLYTVVYGKILDKEFGHSSFKSAFLNLIFRMMVRDTNVNRVCAFVRRLLQVARYHSSEVASGVLFLISETVKDNRLLRKDLVFFLMTGYDTKPVIKTEFVDKEGKGDFKKKHKKKLLENSEEITVKQEVRTTEYNSQIRNPLYCGADLLPFWELVYFQKHFHPTVSLFASKLLEQIFVQYSGDPLEDLTLTRFLDRFVQRNPKKIKTDKNDIAAVFGSRSVYAPKGSRSIKIDSDDFKNLQKDDVAPEDLFLHSYFTTYRKQNEAKKRKRDDDEESIDDEQFTEYLKQMSAFKDIDKIADELDEEEEANLDFASKINKTGERNVASDDEDEEEMSDEDDEDEDLESEEEMNENIKDHNNLSDELGEDFSDDDEDIGSEEEMDFSDEEQEPQRKGKKQNARSKPKSWGSWRDKLVDAEELSQLLEENSDNKYAGTSEDVLNKDKSHKKQLKWEKDRIVSGSKKQFKKFKPNTKKKGNFNKRPFKKGKNKFK
ncbi:CCAAT/enhancer-binding protein zeta [Armadillidium nasatum]|uniref:CCAAT/enhancer-binding protein zeta n=1 Tax=Armadillidium nasatum TaxID=96803 RepID=A0A5N5SVV2_9CRUS|nr:CCAAT/enhancer-binding protein zeta [Armadillidium nasatum]